MELSRLKIATTETTTIPLQRKRMANKPRFNLKHRKDTNKPTLITMQFRMQNTRIVMSTGWSIAPKHWNDTKMRVMDRAGIIDAQSINDGLNRFETSALEVERYYRSNGGMPSALEFKEAMRQKLNGNKGPRRNTFSGFIENFINERASLPSFAKASISVYRTARKHYSSYTRNKTIEFKDVTLEHLARFVGYLRSHDLSDNTVHKIVSTIWTIILEASKRGLTTRPTFNKGDLKITRRDSDSIFLTLDELNALAHLDLTKNKRLERVRDLFLIGAFTGLRFIDFSNIGKGNISKRNGKEFLTITAQKTKDLLEIPVHKIVREILDRNGGIPPKSLSNQNLNSYLKELGRLIGLNEIQIIRTYPGGRLEVKKIPKWELLSSHAARRSFATNAYILGISETHIMGITGHKEHSTFMKYIKMSRSEKADKMVESAFFHE